MIYTIDRETPVKNLKKMTKDELEAIADRARQEGFDVTVSAWKIKKWRIEKHCDFLQCFSILHFLILNLFFVLSLS